MADSEELHTVLRNYDEFDDFLQALNTQENIDEFQSRVEAWGKYVADMYDFTLDEVSGFEIGLIRIAWEAHNSEDYQVELKPRW